ncbi:RHS repeat-associated core domain-containing protein [Streptomyces sp. TBY4]|uniref:RHS repeat-associated core domain-containing protein n=1 Tax=Streptomyces sp. TBY4 TaxID=2962030 RepID=UPI0020B78076|nr:RHS repeat-associated core domain-containing protein [Streptomyces sp. TBY4]MCP3755662.1 RHS repeat protein [Streptomyces sp. TBY4]
MYWPPATNAEVDLGATAPIPADGSLFTTPGRAKGPAAPVPDPTRVGDAPVWVAPAAGEEGPRSGKAAVELEDREAAEKAGLQGMLVSVRPGEGVTEGGPVKVSVDVSHIAGSFSGDWLSRAQLVALPECALTTPERPECRTQTPLATAKDGDRPGLLSAEVPLAAPGAEAQSLSADSGASGGATVFAASSSPSGPSGNFTATSLDPSGTWSSGSNTGGFSWSYPIAVPEGLGGKPSIALSYSSQAVDGRTAATNNQASWIGEGWDYSPGFVERSFKPCSKDGQEGSGDQCLAGENATFSLGGKSSALVKDDTTKEWRLENDDSSKVEHLTGAANGDNNGEYWMVTTTDGTRYYFGAGHKPESSTGPATNSAWTTPVYGNNTGEECHQSTFAASWCQQAWRWNLDFVVDPRGGLITYTYATETNRYKRGASAANPTGTLTSYIRGGNLEKITYGSKLKDADTVKPTAQVLFDVDERCLPVKDVFDCAPSKLTAANQTKWPDVPFDQKCESTGTCENYSATFWTTKRLTKITTQVLNGAGGYDNVDSYALTQSFPDPKDQTAPALWLSTLTHTGYDGATSLATPSVVFNGTLRSNRVDSSDDNRPALNRHRIAKITSETGKVTDVIYAATDCAPGTGLPSTADANTKRCFPVYWNSDPRSPNDPSLDWFHKHVVDRVTERDPFGGSRDQEVRYEYVGGAAWHRDDEELTEDKYRTWNQFRGYGQVITRAGTAPDILSKTSSFYLRGMDGDIKADKSVRTATFKNIAGATVKDSNHLAGTLRELQTFASDGGELVSTSQSDPWLPAATATHSRGAGLPALTARMQGTAASKQKVLLADKTWRSTSQSIDYDERGMQESVLDQADGLPDICTTTSYARNTESWILDRVSQNTRTQAACGVAATEANTLDSSRTHYDNKPFGTLDGPGQPTTTSVLDRFETGQPKYATKATIAYDTYGRVTSTTDAAGANTKSAYTPAAPARPTTLKVTNAKNWTTTTTLHPLRGLPVKTVDQNSRTTEIAYDELGRTTEVWLPGRARAESASQVFTYDLTRTGTSSVTSKTLRADQSYATSISILDAMGQQVQTQSVPLDNAATTRLVTDTAYDSRGRAFKTSGAYVNKNSAPVKTRFIADENMLPAQNLTQYDGLGRPVAGTFYSKAQEQWRSATAYPGADRVDTTPPQGGTATSTITDARGRKTELRQYKAGTPTGAFDATRYGYDTTGQLTQITDPAGNDWTYEYDLQGRQTKAVDPDKGTSTSTYDVADRLASSTDARGTTVFTSYDILGRPTTRNLSAVDGTKLAEYEYDTLLPGLATASTSWVAGKAWRQEITGYDIGYRPTGTKLTVPTGEGALTGTYTTSTNYNPITGLEISTDLPAAGGLPAEDLSTSRNPNGLPVAMGSNTVDYVNYTDYNELGQVQRTTFGDSPKQVVATNILDPATGRLLSTALDKQQEATTSVNTTSYTYTPNGDVTSVTNVQGAARDTQCFTYDYQGRLTEAWTDKGTTTTKPGPSVPGIGGCTNTTPETSSIGGTAPYWQSFTYDVTGNRKTLTDHDPAGDAEKTTVTTNTYPAPGSARPHTPTSTTRKMGSNTPVTTNLTYDKTGNTLTRPDTGDTPNTLPGNGEPTQTLTWNAEGKLASNTTSAGTSTYIYDAAGNRLARKDPGKTTLYTGTDELTRDTATDKVTGTRYYATPGGTTIVRTSAGKLSYIAADHHNTGTTSIDAATLAVQRRFTKPFGEERGTKPTAWPGERGFVGGTQDKSTGLTHIGAREYDPAAGRFLSVDPLMVVGDPRQHNAYQYANNSPLTNWDPTGLYTDDGTGHSEKPDGSPPSNPVTPGGKAPDGGGGYRGGGPQTAVTGNICGNDPDCRSQYSTPSSGAKPDRPALVQTISGYPAQGVPRGSIQDPNPMTAPSASGAELNWLCVAGESDFKCGLRKTNYLLQLTTAGIAGSKAAAGAKGRPGGSAPGGNPVGPGWFPYGSAKIPGNWSGPNMTSKYKKNDNKAGFVWRAPKGQDSVRIDRGDLNSQWATQQVDHVVINSGGRIVGRGGELLPPNARIQDYPVEAHIPLSEWQTWRTWNAP